jgi:hypothetical protein
MTTNTLKVAALLTAFSVAGSADADCLGDKALQALDLRYEEALRVGDTAFLQQLLAEEYTWVHNLAVDKEPRGRLIDRMVKPEEVPKSRRSADVTIHKLENTAVLSGVSLVEKWNTDGHSWRTLHYQFMRTYVKTAGGECQLLSSQTMKIRTEDRQTAP